MRRASLGAVALFVLMAELAAGCGGSNEPVPTENPSSSAGPSIVVPGDLIDQQVVEVTGTKLPPPGDLLLAQCVAREGSDTPDLDRDCDTSTGAAVTFKVQPSGRAAIKFRARAFIGVGVRQEIDCTAEPCLAAVVDGVTFKVVASTRISWAADPKAVPAPTLKLGKINWLKELGTVDVTGAGYPPGSKVQLVQCPPPLEPSASPVDVAAGDCLYDTAKTAMADRSGAFTVTAQIYPKFQRSTGELIDCQAIPTDCLIAAPWPTKNAYRMSAVPLG